MIQKTLTEEKINSIPEPVTPQTKRFSKGKEKIKCPECGSLSLEGGTCTVTAMWCPPFSDEQGNWHTHDYNTEMCHYTCRKCGKRFS